MNHLATKKGDANQIGLGSGSSMERRLEDLPRQYQR
jgi:hypothetical protein